MGKLSEETVIITGASRGLGASMAKRCASEGANVVLTARNESTLQDVAASTTGHTLVAPADVTDDQSVQSVVKQAVDEFGELTGLVNNAAIGLLTLHDMLLPVQEITVEDWRQIIDVNINGVFYFVKYTVPQLLEAGRGNIVNISSGLGRRGEAGWAPYVTSKWGIEGLTRTLADELSPDINVNCLDPGGRVATGFWDHIEGADREQLLPPDVMDDAISLLLDQQPRGVTAESLTAAEWESRLGD